MVGKWGGNAVWRLYNFSTSKTFSCHFIPAACIDPCDLDHDSMLGLEGHNKPEREMSGTRGWML